MALKNVSNARAFIRLTPTKNNIGGIVEEHIRYWRKYDDEQDAKDKAEKAREKLALQNANKDVLELSNLRPDENASYFNEQIISNYESMKPEIARLAKEYRFNGDLSAGLKLQELKKKIESASKMSKLYGEQVAKLNKQKNVDGTFNEELDAPIEKVLDGFSKGLWKLDKNFDFSLYDPNSSDVKTLSPSQMLSEPFMNWNYSKNPEIDTIAKNFALDILDTKDGNKNFDVTNSSTREKRGISQFDGAMSSDSTLSRTIMSKYNKDQENPENRFTKDYSLLSATEKRIVNRYAYKKFTEPLILQETNTEDKRLEEEKIKTERARRANINARTKQTQSNTDNDFPTIEPSKNEDGTNVTNPSAGKIYKGTIPKFINFGSTSSTKGSRIQGFEIMENGGIRFTGVKLSKDEYDEDGNPLPTNEEIVIDNINSVNEILRQIPNGKTKSGRIKNAKEFLDIFQSKLGVDIDFSRKQGKETPQERIARLKQKNGLK